MIYIPINDIEVNTGQIEGLPKNPRFIKDDKFKKLVKSIEENPEMLELRELLVYPFNGKYVIIGGNMRYRAMKELGYKEVPCKVIPETATVEQLKAYTIKDNNGFGEWDFDLLANEWDFSELEDWGVDLPNLNIIDNEELSENNTDDDFIGDEKVEESLQDMMIKDVLFDFDNDYEIPNLLINRQGGHVELPITPWGANSRLKKNVNTYHFYVDDYRFEALWKDPIKLINSGCKQIVEPNCSLHDQTPIAYGIHLIYKKRFLARYMQELGVNVYVDLNVSHKFAEYNVLGVPKGWNSFFTRGFYGSNNNLTLDLEIARQISGLETPNLVIYGGGKMAKEFCKKNRLLYLTDFINDKK